MRIKRTAAAIALALCAVAICMGATILGYLDMQTRSGAPGSPGSGYLRIWNDNSSGPVHCKTSGGASCFFDSTSTTVTHTLGYGFGYTGGGALPGTGFAQNEVTFSCTINGSWYLKTDGTATIDVLVGGSSITGGSPPSGTGNSSGSTAGWTTAVSGPAEFKWNLSSVSGGATFATVSFACN